MPASESSGRPRGAATRRGESVVLASLVGLVGLLVLLSIGLRPDPAAARPLLQDPTTPTPLPGTGSVAGQAWIDTDADGVIDAGEGPLAGLVVAAKSDATGGSTSATTGADGKYRLVGLTPGLYEISATPPSGYLLTTQGVYNTVIAAGGTLSFNFGAHMPPTLTPSPTTPPLLDINGAEQLSCGGVYSGNTQTGKNNVSSYSCRPWWDESGNEKVYRLELNARQPVTVTLLNASADLDLFLLRYALPESCVAGEDNYLSYAADAGPYFLSVDGYRGASGAYTFRVDCPEETQATFTPTFTPSPTPTNTPTGTPAPTSTPSPTRPPERAYMPVVSRPSTGPTPHPVTFVLQDGLFGYAGTTDTTLDSWEPANPHGSNKFMRLFYARNAQTASQAEPVVHFDVTLLPRNASVEKALLRLYVSSTPQHDIRARIAGLLTAWDEATATWEIADTDRPWAIPGAGAENVDRTAWLGEPQLIAEGSRWYEFDVTALVRGWAAVPANNYGLLIGALAGDSNASVEARFTSREGSADDRPQLVISYTMPPSATGQ